MVFNERKNDSLFPNFDNDLRNIRLRLAKDGMNPNSNLISKHSPWLL